MFPGSAPFASTLHAQRNWTPSWAQIKQPAARIRCRKRQHSMDHGSPNFQWIRRVFFHRKPLFLLLIPGFAWTCSHNSILENLWNMFREWMCGSNTLCPGACQNLTHSLGCSPTIDPHLGGELHIYSYTVPGGRVTLPEEWSPAI